MKLLAIWISNNQRMMNALINQEINTERNSMDFSAPSAFKFNDAEDE